MVDRLLNLQVQFRSPANIGDDVGRCTGIGGSPTARRHLLWIAVVRFDESRRRIVDLRGSRSDLTRSERDSETIYFTDSVFFDTSSTELREDLSDGELEREEDLPVEVANYIEKYNLY